MRMQQRITLLIMTSLSLSLIFNFAVQGGFDDRQKLRRAEIQKNKDLKKQAELDDLVLEPRRMAEAGEGVASIVAAMQRLGSPISEADVQAIVDDVKDQDRRRAELRSEGVATASDPQVRTAL